MKYAGKTKGIVLMSMVLLAAVIGAALTLGGCMDESNPHVLYVNNKFGFSLLIPPDFMDAVAIKEDGNFIYFVNKEMQAFYPESILGVVGRIEIYDKGKHTKEIIQTGAEVYGLRYLGENEKYYFGWAHATDVQVPPEAPQPLKDQFRPMEARFEEIIKTFKLINAAGP
jgi:hypothetical protein